MALDSATIWGKDIADAIKAIGIAPGTPVNDSQLEAVWAAVKGEDLTQLGQGDVAPGSFVAPPGTGGGPVTGTGGPVT